ncbi:hypothetical protein Ahy_A06g027320 [Arachis hypogaea]|uniref:CCHC-type domain-containing protein n=1 Tax=Arachis hypogaea TaxID=3818 RepID=A0A445CNA4_ARAHY|nr:hypothetical protein Ahy_A06g027320 [Arachis hypogaea]
MERSNTQGAWCLQHVGGVEARWHVVVEPRKQHAGGVLSQHAGGVLTWQGHGESARGGRADVATSDWPGGAARGERDESARRGVLTRAARGGVLSALLYIRKSSRVFSIAVVGVIMEGTANLVVHRNGEIIRNTHEGVRFVSQNPFLFVVPCTMTLMELQNGLCQSMENGTLMRVSRILYRNSVVVFGGLIQFDAMSITDEASMQKMFQIHQQTQMRHPQIEVYVDFETVKAVAVQNDIDIHDDRAAVYQGMNSDSEDDFEATYEAGDEDEDGNVGVEAAAENVVVGPSSSQPMDVPPFMRELDLEAMHAPKFPEYTNIGVADGEDGEFRIGMEYSSRKSVVAAIRSFTIAKGVDYERIEASMQQAWNIVVHHFDRRNEFTPLGDPDTWPPYEGPTLVANPAQRRTSKGRPKLTRYLNEMDSCDIRGPRICRLCGAQGHSRSRCPQRVGPSGAAS